MKKLSPTVITISLSCIIVIIVAVIFASPSKKDEYETVTWNLDLGMDPTPYTKFLTSLRRHLRSKDVCQFPTTTKTPETAKQYILVHIIDTSQRTVTLAFRAMDVYFLGYQDMYNGKERANFFSDEFKKLKSSDLFPEAKDDNRVKLPFESRYGPMEIAAGLGHGGRKNLALGTPDLNSIIDTIYGKFADTKRRDEAKFCLIVIQMVAEAVRLRYIEQQMIAFYGLSYLPDDAFVKLENNWGKISQAIHISAAAKPPCVKVKVSYPLNVDTVEGLRIYISLLKFKKREISESIMEETEEFDDSS